MLRGPVHGHLVQFLGGRVRREGGDPFRERQANEPHDDAAPLNLSHQVGPWLDPGLRHSSAGSSTAPPASALRIVDISFDLRGGTAEGIDEQPRLNDRDS